MMMKRGGRDNMKKTIFQEIMGTNPRIKVLEYLLEWNRYDLTISDIARGSKISRNKATEIINELTKKNILINIYYILKSILSKEELEEKQEKLTM